MAKMMANLSASDREEIRKLLQPFIGKVLSGILQGASRQEALREGKAALKGSALDLAPAPRDAFPSANEETRRTIPTKIRKNAVILEIIYDAIYYELELKVNSLLRTLEDTRPPQEQVDHALRLALATVQAVQSPKLDLDDSEKTNRTGKKSIAKLTEKPAGRDFLAKIFTLIYGIYVRTGNSARLNEVMDKMEEMTGSVPVDLLHKIVLSDKYDPKIDRSLADYFVAKLDSLCAASLGKTAEIAGTIIERASAEPECAAQISKLVSAVSAKIPGLYQVDLNKATALTRSILDFVELLPAVGNDSVSRHGLYREPMIRSAVPLVEGSHLHASGMFDLIMPPGRAIDEASRRACMEMLPLFNMRDASLATALFTRIADQELSGKERSSLQNAGVSMFAKNAAQKTDQALILWKKLLKLQQGSAKGAIALVENILPSAQAVFPKNAGFARDFLGAIDEALTGRTNLQFGVVGCDLLAQKKPFGFVVMDRNGQVAIAGKTGVAGPAHMVLAETMAAHRDDLAAATPIVEFITAAQSAFRRPVFSATPRTPAFKTGVIEAIRNIA